MENLGREAKLEQVNIGNSVAEYVFDLENEESFSMSVLVKVTEDDSPCLKFEVNLKNPRPSEETSILVELTTESLSILDEEGYEEGFYNMLCDTTMRLVDELGEESRLVSALAVFLSEQFYPQEDPVFNFLVFKVWEATKMFVPAQTIH